MYYNNRLLDQGVELGGYHILDHKYVLNAFYFLVESQGTAPLVFNIPHYYSFTGLVQFHRHWTDDWSF